MFEAIQFSGSIGRADQRSNGRTADNIRPNSDFFQAS